jgi:hypothetical protein
MIKGKMVNPFLGFDFQFGSARRKQPISSVMPTNAGLIYKVVLADAIYCGADGGDTHIHSFNDLSKIFCEKDYGKALQIGRKSGRLIESRRVLPERLISKFQKSADDLVYVRHFGLVNSQENGSIVTRGMLRLELINPRLGEVEICDAESTWYMRFRDDDPLIFVAVSLPLGEDLMREFPDLVLAVDADFVYAE